MTKINFIEPSVGKVVDRSDGKEASYSKLPRINGFILIVHNHKRGEGYLIQFYEPKKIEKDTRKALIRISHHRTRDGERNRKVHDRIDFVIDLKSHGKHSPHLNLSGKAEKICEGCPKCKKYFPHSFKIAYKYYEGKSYKDIDWVLTGKKFKEKLKENGFFKEFKVFLDSDELR